MPQYPCRSLYSMPLKHSPDSNFDINRFIAKSKLRNARHTRLSHTCLKLSANALGMGLPASAGIFCRPQNLRALPLKNENWRGLFPPEMPRPTNPFPRSKTCANRSSGSKGYRPGLQASSLGNHGLLQKRTSRKRCERPGGGREGGPSARLSGKSKERGECLQTAALDRSVKKMLEAGEFLLTVQHIAKPLW